MYAQGIDVFNEADGDHVVVCIPHHFQLQFLPAQNGFLHQYLANQAGLQPPGADGFELLHVVDQAASCAAHGIGGTKHHGIAQLVSDLKRFLHAVGYFAAGHFNAQGIHSVFELDPIFPSFYGIHLDADNLDMVFVQDTRLVQLGA